MKKKRIIQRKQLKSSRSPSPKKALLTAVDLQNVRVLAERLGEFLPLKGFRSSFSLDVVAKERGLQKYLPEGVSNKKEAFSDFICGMLRDRKRATLKKLIRETLPKSIERRHTNGHPVLKPEADALVDVLKALNIDLEEEIAELNLPTDRPKIVPPPPETRKALDALGLHPSLLPDCRQLFIDGHINESVRKAAEKFEVIVQGVSGLSDKRGKGLMSAAFGGQLPAVPLSALVSQSEKDEQEGYAQISMGIMLWWRNNTSHGDEPQLPHHEALGRLALISNLLHRLDSRMP